MIPIDNALTIQFQPRLAFRASQLLAREPGLNAKDINPRPDSDDDDEEEE
jgi:hypothetical protein